MSKHIASLVTESGVLLFVGADRYVIGNDHPNFARIKDAIAVGDYDAVADLADIRSAVRKWMASGHEFALTDDLIHLNGIPFSNAVTDKVLKMIDAGNTPDPLFNFLRKVRENPSATAQDELFLFCVANGFMIHEDGDIIAYKSVRGDYTDIHSGKFNNTVGSVNVMPRFQVDDDRTRTCSNGLHFASYEYASTWAGAIDGVSRRLMVMKIHPRDVVSIPNDYNNQKGRCARYEVIAEIGGRNISPLPKQEVYTDSDLGRGDNSAVKYDELKMEIAHLNDQYDALQDRITQILDLGGDVPGSLEDEAADLLAQIYDLEQEQDNL
jgi:hypothetical protein